jgi:hypothetical protein
MKSSQQLEERQLNWLRVQLFWCTELYCSITGYLFTEELDPLLVHARTWDNILVFLIHVLGLLVPGVSNHSSCPSTEIIDFKITFNKFLFIWLYMLKFVEQINVFNPKYTFCCLFYSVTWNSHIIFTPSTPLCNSRYSIISQLRIPVVDTALINLLINKLMDQSFSWFSQSVSVTSNHKKCCSMWDRFCLKLV